MDWKDFLAGRKPRADLAEPFAADSFDVEHPALLNSQPALNAAAVAARLLEIVAHRGGTRVKPSAVEKLRRVLWRALPGPATHLCDDEASRILRWLTHPEAYEADASQADASERSETPEVDIMFEADLDSRISVARLALDEGYDLELEYLDPQENIWPRIRCTPIELLNLEADVDQASPEAESEPVLLVDSDFGDLQIPLHHVRWLMPVSSHRHRRAEGKQKPAGKLLSFPTGDQGHDEEE
jgi:hypothetical protein